MTRKDYIRIANVVANHESEVSKEFVDSLCSALKSDNPNFSKDRFMDYLEAKRVTFMNCSRCGANLVLYKCLMCGTPRR